MSDIYYNTFAGAIDAAKLAADAAHAQLSKPTELWSLCQEPLFYGQTRTASFSLEALNGKPTRKFFHVTIYRMDSGRYELTTYIL